MAEVTLAQVEACLALWKAVREAKEDAVSQRNDMGVDEMCVTADVWTQVLDAYADVQEQWDL